MGEISNKTLAILVVIAILVSLISLFVGRARIITVGQAETTTGAVQANVQTDIDITITGTPIDFGDVIGSDRISSESHCGLDATCGNADDVYDTDCASGGGVAQCNKVYPDTAQTKHKLTVTSVGATQTDISYMSNQPLFAKLYEHGDQGLDNLDVEDDAFQAKVKVTGSEEISQPCNNGLGPAFSSEGVFEDVNLVDQEVVNGCVPNDYFEMYFRIKVPMNEPAAARSATLTFTGTAS